MTRKTRSDSTTAAVEAIQAAGSVIQPPAYIALRECDRPFWDSLTACKPADRWSESDLVDAASLARCKADIERIQREIDAEGDILDGKLNPRHALLETLTRRSMALARTLQIHSRARNGESRNQQAAFKTSEHARGALRLVGSENLIPHLGENE